MDTRHLFGSLTSRKPYRWADAGSVRVDQLTGQQLQALRQKPVVLGMASPLDVDAVYVGRVPGGPSVRDVEFIVAIGGQFYYVNTEGYNYARYVVRLEGWVE